MEEFRSIIIPEKIIIVENNEGQGYIVPDGNEKILESAMNWAKTTVRGEGSTWEEQWKNSKIVEGIQHKYTNGNFKFKLNKSADYSYNGGKLSFWNCDITAPDGKIFLIGINQELLCKFLLNCTLVKGEAQENIWLGREGNNTGVYTECMEDFEQAKKEKEKRKLKKTTNYDVGDVVGTLTMEFVYLGKIDPNYYIVNEYDYSANWNEYKRNLRVLSPGDWQIENKHVYLEKFNGKYFRLTTSGKKRSYIKFDKKDNVTLEELRQFAKNSKNESLLEDVLQYSTLTPEEIRDDFNSIGRYTYILR